MELIYFLHSQTNIKFKILNTRVAKELQEHSEKALNDPMKYLSNPVNAYLLVKRFAIDWTNIVEHYIKPHGSQGESMVHGNDTGA